MADDQDLTICFCYNVSRSRIIEAIRAGATTVHDLQVQTSASTGCGGCEFDLLDLLEQESATPPKGESS